MGKNEKRIIEKIRINQSIVKNKSKTSAERQRAFLELKRLNKLKSQGTIVKRPSREMLPVSHDFKPYEHNYLIYNTDKKNNSSVNIITHSKNIRQKKKIKSLSQLNQDSYISLKSETASKGFRNKDKELKFYDFFESNMNGKIDSLELQSIINSITNKKNNSST